MQRPPLLGKRKLIAGFRKVVHADVHVPGLDELKQAGAKNLKLHHAFGEMPDKGTLLLFQPGNVRIAEQCDAVRAETDDLVDSVSEALGRLIRQAVNQVHVDAVEAEPARARKQIARHFEGLEPVNRFLHVELKILDAHAQAVKAQLSNRLEMRARGHTGIDFDADFTVGRELEMFASKFKKILDLFR